MFVFEWMAFKGEYLYFEPYDRFGGDHAGNVN